MPEEKRSPATPVRLAYGPEYLQFGELYLPERPRPQAVIPLIHGGYWRARYDLTLMHGLAEDLARRGYAAWNIEYRRVGDKGGAWPGTFLDVARAVDYLRVLAPRFQIDLQRVVPVGHSAGGHLAFWLAARPRNPGRPSPSDEYRCETPCERSDGFPGRGIRIRSRCILQEDRYPSPCSGPLAGTQLSLGNRFPWRRAGSAG